MSRLPWSRAARGELATVLREHSFDITVTSDARELCGLPRLSEASPSERTADAVLRWIWSERGAAAYWEASEAREHGLQAIEHADKAAVKRVRAELGLRRPPASWRLPQIHGVIVAVRVAELAGGAA